MAKLHSLLVLQQFMRSLGEDMEEAELVRSTNQDDNHSRPQSHDPSDLRQGSRALAGPDFLSMRRVIVPYSQPIRFARFDRKSVNRGLPVLDQTRALDSCRRSEGSWALGTRMDENCQAER